MGLGLSKRKTKRLHTVLREYSRLLGLKDPGPKFSARQHIWRICALVPRIKAYVLPMGGKVTDEAAGRMLEYMIAHPIGDFVVSDISQDRPPRRNPKIDARKRQRHRQVAVEVKREFYASWDWKQARYDALKKYGPTCMLCGASRGDKTAQGDPVKICVDHIRPLSTHWERRLDQSNLQVLCDECNRGKGVWDETDWRSDQIAAAG